MPSPNTIRMYANDNYYHVYNRGVEKRKIFMDDRDYKMFLYYFFIYLAPVELVTQHYPNIPNRLIANNMYGKIELLSYCLMPNHFHLLIKQLQDGGITKFLRQIMNGFTAYFNKRHDRVGSLMQGKFKASLIQTDEYLLQASSYIHKNPLSLAEYNKLDKLQEYPWSSYRIYLGLQQTTYIKSGFILDYFAENNGDFSYKSFVEGQNVDLDESLLIDSID